MTAVASGSHALNHSERRPLAPELTPAGYVQHALHFLAFRIEALFPGGAATTLMKPFTIEELIEAICDVTRP